MGCGSSVDTYKKDDVSVGSESESDEGDVFPRHGKKKDRGKREGKGGRRKSTSSGKREVKKDANGNVVLQLLGNVSPRTQMAEYERTHPKPMHIRVRQLLEENEGLKRMLAKEAAALAS